MLHIRRRLITNGLNFSAARRAPLTGIVLHSEGANGPRKANEVASLYAWFQGNKRRVSAHYYVTFDGRIEQYVLDEHTAYQAGNSRFNAATIGIEHQDDGASDLYTDLQYETSARLVVYLCQQYAIPVSQAERGSPVGIMIHKDVVGSSTSCPVDLDWARILQRARELAAANEAITAEVEIVESAQKAQPGLYQVTADVLNIRSTPNLDHAPLGQLKRNQRVRIGAVNEGWGKVTAFLDPPAPGANGLPDPVQVPCWISLAFVQTLAAQPELDTDPA